MVKISKAKQHPHWYLHFLELGLLLAIFDPENVEFGHRDVDLVFEWELGRHTPSN
jgi:hypothetical protein